MLGHVAAGVAARAGFGVFNLELDLFRQLQADGIAVELVQLDQRALHQEVQRAAHHLAGKGVRLEGLLVQEMRALAVAVEVGGLDQLQVRLLEPVAGLERLVEDRAREQVAHLQTDQGLPAPRRGGGNLCIHAVIRGVFKLEIHLALYGNGFDQCGHGFLKRTGI